MAKTFNARLNGLEVTAKKNNGRWMVGGDFVSPGQSVLIELPKGDRWGWFRLKGCFLSFEDYSERLT